MKKTIILKLLNSNGKRRNFEIVTPAKGKTNYITSNDFKPFGNVHMLKLFKMPFKFSFLQDLIIRFLSSTPAVVYEKTNIVIST